MTGYSRVAHLALSKTIKAVSAPIEVVKPTNALPNEAAMVRLRPERALSPRSDYAAQS